MGCLAKVKSFTVFEWCNSINNEAQQIKYHTQPDRNVNINKGLRIYITVLLFSFLNVLTDKFKYFS